MLRVRIKSDSSVLMTHETLLNELWATTLTRLGGTASIAASARETRAFLRPREITSAVDLLRIILAYCLGGMGLRTTSAWAASIGLADLSNVALLGRLRKSSAWMERLVATLLAADAGAAAHGRTVRLLDATTVRKAGVDARKNGRLWRIHAAFDLPSERFSFFELTDEKGAEHFDRVPVTPGEIRIGDRGYCRAGKLAQVCAQGADIIVRAGWNSARWLDEQGQPLDLIAVLKGAGKEGRLDRRIGMWRGTSAPLPVRLVAFRKPDPESEASRTKVRREAAKEGHQIASETLVAAEWVLLLTSLPADTFSAEDVGELYRARWRIEMAFKRLKSLVGLAGPPGEDPQVAKTWILAHLLLILLLEPHTAVVEDSPRSADSRLAA
jgi:Transposase DDE domain